MAHAGTHGATEDNSDRPKLLYRLNDKPPPKDSIFVAFQHVCAIFIPVVTPGLLITLFAGFMISIFLGVAGFSRMATLPLINVPIPFRFGLDFDIVTFISFAIIYVALTLEVLGDITATSMVSAEPIEGATYMRRLKSGILGDGANPLVRWG